MSARPSPSPGAVELGFTRSDRIWAYAMFGGGGLLVFLLAPVLSSWLAAIPIVPFKGVLEWVASFDQPWAWVVRPAVGLLIGLGVAFLAIVDEHRLVVGSDSVVVLHDKDRRTLRRDQIVGVHLEGKKVVIDGTQGRVLFNRQVEAKRDKIRAAFLDHGYPWESA